MDKHQPPKFFVRFFRWICNAEYYEELQGDLMESYRLNLSTNGLRFASSVMSRERIAFISNAIVS